MRTATAKATMTARSRPPFALAAAVVATLAMAAPAQAEEPPRTCSGAGNGECVQAPTECGVYPHPDQDGIDAYLAGTTKNGRIEIGCPNNKSYKNFKVTFISRVYEFGNFHGNADVINGTVVAADGKNHTFPVYITQNQPGQGIQWTTQVDLKVLPIYN
ncbi:hypothetical protein L6E12_32040 [Actinokineospora sp. PR83]|uniref:hypothetical protein n=1 Tax=Actinokineospora sp. PR83 TaxID=2884908 RepID=UPI001F2FFD7C|nr:hypothetical protein [Actinokineospora sp. PR83]MCG8920408.1 hypothetical protein [Actinokineospora sp. PR83]